MSGTGASHGSRSHNGAASKASASATGPKERSGARPSGWVRNRSDGSVEALFSGAGHVILEMLKRCQDGPSSAAVAEVAIVEEGGGAPLGFSRFGRLFDEASISRRWLGSSS